MEQVFGQGKCTFGMRMPLNVNRLNEIIAREMKHFRDYKHFKPNFQGHFVTPKFYARHDIFHVDSHELAMHIQDYQHHLAQLWSKGPLCKYKLSATENQEYGWFTTKPFENKQIIDRNDPRFFRPIVESQDSKRMASLYALEEKKNASK